MMRAEPIRVVAADDPRVAAYRAVRDRDLAGRGGRFMAEGEVVVRALLSERSRFGVESVLVGEARLERLAALLGRVPPAVPIYAAAREVLDGIAGFPLHRGVLAVGLRREPPPAEALLPPSEARALVLVLIGLANHDNVGGAFRNAAAFGADAVLLDGTSCDPLYRKALRVSVGACLTVPFRRHGSPEEIVGTLRDAGFSLFALSPGGGLPVEEVLWPRRTALLVGTEGAGLPRTLLGELPTVRIGMTAGFDSLNVAAASGIALHAVRSGARD